MNNWASLENDTLALTGWHLWQRTDKHNITVFQMTSNIDLTPKSAAGFLTIESLFKTYGIASTTLPTIH